jgi:hypothetical protein
MDNGISKCLDVRGGGVPHQPGDLLDADPRWLVKLTNVVRSSRRVQLSPIPASVQTRLNIFRTFPRPARRPDGS